MYSTKAMAAASAIALALVCGVAPATHAVLHAQVAATPKDGESKPEAKTKSLAIDFGKVERGVILTHSVRIINTYDAPLRINGPRTS